MTYESAGTILYLVSRQFPSIENLCQAIYENMQDTPDSIQEALTSLDAVLVAYAATH
jgi:hypothetical protein